VELKSEARASDIREFFVVAEQEKKAFRVHCNMESLGNVGYATRSTVELRTLHISFFSRRPNSKQLLSATCVDFLDVIFLFCVASIKNLRAMAWKHHICRNERWETQKAETKLKSIASEIQSCKALFKFSPTMLDSITKRLFLSS